ncbi:MAG: toxin [Helicobacter sp.]|uniref:toxin n=1 Tax=Helicobacter sp. 10-6591 TaxID=2004998 RepID=UPI00215D28B3|nr:toxin [Helicobacter sp. 10-6591]MCI6217379.1 toxin [Helicobacter sp.]MCI7484491.1 toxin [Helicobacter sp.]MDD7567655.1 toxin [Helicobacter sp.]MDY5740296.1 toxin [Helicobacter sp.]
MIKKILILLLLIVHTNAKDPETQDLDEFTPPISIRSVLSGDFLGSGKDRNWVIRNIPVTEDILRDDPFAGFNLGAVQFVLVDTKDTCLAILETGLFGIKSCKEDLDRKEYETLYTIIPTTTPAVQIRSFVLSKNECMVAFKNPRLPRGRGIGLRPCDVDRWLNVSMDVLFLLNPPIRDAVLINP